MKGTQKDLIVFLVQSVIFMILILLFDWIEEEFKTWYYYLIQGLIYGLLMTLYFKWVDNREKKKDKKDSR